MFEIENLEEKLVIFLLPGIRESEVGDGVEWREGDLLGLLFCNLWEAKVSQILTPEGN